MDQEPTLGGHQSLLHSHLGLGIRDEHRQRASRPRRISCALPSDRSLPKRRAAPMSSVRDRRLSW
jgi:hypothetical protein